jgi:dihydrodipicolinate synthase/N-acetylneuraminate lyase
MKVIEVARESIREPKLMMVGTGMEATQETIRFTSQAV